MKNTTPRNYPFPECAPPLVEDASDIVQMGNLAITIDQDMTNLAATADNNIMSPDGCSQASAAPQVLPVGSFINFDTLHFDNTPGQVMNSAAGIRVRTSGTYLVSFWINTTSPAGNDNLAAILTLEGLGDRLLEGTGQYDAGSVSAGSNISGSGMFRSPAGRVYRLRPTFGTSTAPITVAFSQLSIVRVGPQ